MDGWLRSKLGSILQRLDSVVPPTRAPQPDARLASELARLDQDISALEAMLAGPKDSFHHSLAANTTTHHDALLARRAGLLENIAQLRRATMTHRPDARTHLVVGGYPPGAPAGHDMDYARRTLLAWLGERAEVRCTLANDFRHLDEWLPDARLLVTYVAGPFPDAEQNALLGRWLHGGGRWLALHGTAGGKAERYESGRGPRRRMVKMAHHQILGSFFLNHPPLRRFEVRVSDPGCPLTRGLPGRFEVVDELYLIEVLDPDRCQVLLTTELAADPSPEGFGFSYERDTSAGPDGVTRTLGYRRQVGSGAVVYVALGHCHSPASNTQPRVDESAAPGGETPLEFHGSWENPHFERLVRNAIDWGLGEP